MHRNIRIRNAGTYHPEKQVNNEYFVEHFRSADQEMGNKIADLLEVLGRKNRYIADFPNETVITMGIKAAQAAITRAEISVLDLDGIIFSTDTPEYTSPSNALLIRDAIKAENAELVYDLNANCVGMVVAIDQARAIMTCNKRLKKILIIGSTMIHHYGASSNPITYAAIGDAAAAIIIEAIDSDKPRGFIDSLYATETDLSECVLMPECGMSKIYDPLIPDEKKKWAWLPFETTELEGRFGKVIHQLLADNNYTIDQVSNVFMSQFSLKMIAEVSEISGIPMKKFKYTGDKYSYTGTSSPFMAYHHAIEEEEIAENDLVIFISAGSGLTMTAILYVA